MKAAVYTQYGPPEVLHLEEIDKPVPKNNEVLIKMQATAVCSGEIRLRKPEPAILVRLMYGLRTPKRPILGVEVSGEIEAIGKDIKEFKVGDKVMGSTNDYCGTYAEYIAMPANDILTLRPDEISIEQGACTFFGGHTALHFLRKGGIKADDRVLIYGASGSVGTYAVQLAKHFGAEVTAVCSAGNADLVRSIGADHVIDYKKEDFTKSGKIYDIIFDTQGKTPFYRSLRSLSNNGSYLLAVAINFKSMLNMLVAKLISKKNVIGGVAHEHRKDLELLRDLVASGKISPVIDRVYTLDQIAEAHRYVEIGHKKGNVVIHICD